MSYTDEDCDRQMEAYNRNLEAKKKRDAEYEEEIKKAEQSRKEYFAEIRRLNTDDQQQCRAAPKSNRPTEHPAEVAETTEKQEGSGNKRQDTSSPTTPPPADDTEAANSTMPPPKKRRGTRPTSKRPSVTVKNGAAAGKGTRPTGERPPKPLKTDKKGADATPPDSVDNDNCDYEVGYGKPPRRTQFKKGQSGNPVGRPKGSKNSDTILEETLNKKLKVRENGSTREICVREGMIKKQAELALKGDQRAIKFLFDRDDQLSAKLKAKTEQAEAEGGDELDGAEMNIMEELERQIIERHEASKNDEEQDNN